MPKGVKQKPSFTKAGENPRNGEATTDDLSTVDQNCDFVKANEQVRSH